MVIGYVAGKVGKALYKGSVGTAKAGVKWAVPYQSATSLLEEKLEEDKSVLMKNSKLLEAVDGDESKLDALVSKYLKDTDVNKETEKAYSGKLRFAQGFDVMKKIEGSALLKTDYLALTTLLAPVAATTALAIKGAGSIANLLYSAYYAASTGNIKSAMVWTAYDAAGWVPLVGRAEQFSNKYSRGTTYDMRNHRNKLVIEKILQHKHSEADLAAQVNEALKDVEFKPQPQEQHDLVGTPN